jgi:hypothetical protein
MLATRRWHIVPASPATDFESLMTNGLVEIVD